MIDKLTIDEVIEHCKKTVDCENWSIMRGGRSGGKMYYTKRYLEHLQVGEWLTELKKYKDLEAMLGIPFDKMVELCKEHVPDSCKYPKRVKVLTDDSVAEWEQYKQDRAIRCETIIGKLQAKVYECNEEYKELFKGHRSTHMFALAKRRQAFFESIDIVKECTE